MNGGIPAGLEALGPLGPLGPAELVELVELVEPAEPGEPVEPVDAPSVCDDVVVSEAAADSGCEEASE